MKQVLLIELNEVNFEFVERYAAMGRLPEFERLFARHGYLETSSENHDYEWEPWIQWVTAHTGKSLAEHGVFRLGDVLDDRPDQVWEALERAGLHVGAISPMNAVNRLTSPAFFVPDPWCKTKVSAPPLIERIYWALAASVDANAEGRIPARAVAPLLLGLAAYARPPNYLTYLSLAARSVVRHWPRAVFLDVMLCDIFIRAVRKTRPNFASIFLNAGAHLQHHYMFSSAAYTGENANPEWYVPKGADPVLEALIAYDQFLAQLRGVFSDARIMLATGLHQVPHDKETYYWRLKDHASYLRQIGVPFTRVEPRMSRDFVVFCRSMDEAVAAEAVLLAAKVGDGERLFDVDNRGQDLFVELVYPRDIDKHMGWIVGDKHFDGLRNQVAFVAIKNGRHDGVGYFLDTAMDRSERTLFPLRFLRQRILDACGVPSATLMAQAAHTAA